LFKQSVVVSASQAAALASLESKSGSSIRDALAKNPASRNAARS
jgi:hypothetical protein